MNPGCPRIGSLCLGLPVEPNPDSFRIMDRIGRWVYNLPKLRIGPALNRCHIAIDQPVSDMARRFRVAYKA
jgi:hypothetical protein